MKKLKTTQARSKQLKNAPNRWRAFTSIVGIVIFVIIFMFLGRNTEESISFPLSETIVLENQQSDANATAWVEPITGMEFVKIPDGCFQMGSNDGYYNDEKPVHEVCVQRFWMGKYEVTQAQWNKVMGYNPSRFRGTDRPVERVNWHDAQDFLKKLNQHNNTQCRLPTEAEWEYAARAGSTGQYSKAHNGIEVTEVNLSDYAWYWHNSKGTHPVGQKQPNAFGLYDMHGNVWEWLQDWYGADYYVQSPKNNPLGSDSGKDRLIRGGTWYHFPAILRVATRSFGKPDSRGFGLGLRVSCIDA